MTWDSYSPSSSFSTGGDSRRFRSSACSKPSSTHRWRGLPQNLWAERRTGSPSSDPQRARVLARPRCVGLTAWTPAPRTRARPLVVLLERVLASYQDTKRTSRQSLFRGARQDCCCRPWWRHSSVTATSAWNPRVREQAPRHERRGHRTGTWESGSHSGLRRGRLGRALWRVHGRGSFVWPLVLTDIASGWTGCVSSIRRYENDRLAIVPSSWASTRQGGRGRLRFAG